MAEPNKIDIPVNVRPDTKGLDETAKKLGLVERAGKSALSALRGLSRLHFMISGIERVGTFLKNLTGNEEEARAKMRELAAETEKAADAKKVKELAESYKQLAEAINEAATARKRANEIEDMEKSAERSLEDSQAEQAKAAEIAELDPSDPLYERKKAQIEAKYSGEKAVRSATRAKEDAETNERRTWDERSAKIGEADDLRWNANRDREVAAGLRRRAQEADAASVAENEEDNKGFWSNFFSNVKNIVSGQWSKVGDSRTAEGDKLREQQAEEAKRLKAEADAIEAKAAEKEKAAAAADAEAEHLANKASAYSKMSSYGNVGIWNAQDQAAAGNASAGKALADDAARRASALAAAPELAAQADSLRARIAAEQGRKDAANMGVFQAQNALDLARANGGKTGDLTAGLQSAQSAANEVNASADAAINALTKTLKDVEARLKAAQSFLEKESSRNAWESTDLNASNL